MDEKAKKKRKMVHAYDPKSGEYTSFPANRDEMTITETFREAFANTQTRAELARLRKRSSK